MSDRQYDLIIFDCDGTLVNSEFLNNKVTANLLNESGLTEYTPEKCMADFAGRSWGDILPILKERHKTEIPSNIIDLYVERVQIEMREIDIAIDGANDFVRVCNDNYKIAVGSNGERSNVLRGLELQGFMDYFSEDIVFTKGQVTNPKPAPDLFLYAAEQMNVDPSRCLVIEDSFSGAKAGVAAGMDVFGFMGVSHDQKESEKVLRQAGVIAIFDNFIHMGDALKL